jgi:hypothetical protein
MSNGRAAKPAKKTTTKAVATTKTKATAKATKKTAKSGGAGKA